MRRSRLHQPGKGLRERIPYFGVRETSVYTAAQMKPEVTAATLAAIGAVALAALSLKDHLRVRRIRREVRAEYK